MNVPEACERALRDGFIAASIAGTYRCFRLDDLTLEPTEPTATTTIGIMASPDTPRGYKDSARAVPVTIALHTFFAADRKHAVLTALETSIRNNLESEAFSSQFTEATGVTYNAIVFTDSGQPIADQQDSIIELSFVLHVCAAWATA